MSKLSQYSIAIGSVCRVSGCTDCKPGKAHYCKKCQTCDVDHRSSVCPHSA